MQTENKHNAVFLLMYDKINCLPKDGLLFIVIQNNFTSSNIW